ncbi:MAG: hypothetical protein K6F93_00030 [Lachnospiraceae bacterium]|nr:hypothetical protein [Lachnospiraceae bacterium]
MKSFRSYVTKGLSLAAIASLIAMILAPISGNTQEVKAAGSYVKSLTLSTESVTLTEDEVEKAVVTATVKATGSAKKTITAKSSDKEVANVYVEKAKSGLYRLTIIADDPGTCVISVKTKGRNASGKKITKKIKVTVLDDDAYEDDDDDDDDEDDDDDDDDDRYDTKNDVNNGKDEKESVNSDKVTVTVTSETFSGKYETNESGKPEIKEANDLTRKYISFDPWPTTDDQIDYVIRNYSDPYVTASLFIVALDNFEKSKDMNDRSGRMFEMIESICTGDDILDGSTYKIDNFAVQRINVNYGMGEVLLDGGSKVPIYSFAPRAYMKGATPENNYTPEGGSDKTKWKIVVDEYVYNGDIDNGYITVCPQRYTLEKETEASTPVHVDHNAVLRIGMRRHKATGIWVPTPASALSGEVSGNVKPFDITSTVLFSNNYVPPVIDQGF